jgi:hypothetical protein
MRRGGMGPAAPARASPWRGLAPATPGRRAAAASARLAPQPAARPPPGGGNYLERETIQAWATRAQPARQVVYGCTDLLTGNEFLDQLQELGRRSGS